MNQTTDIAPDQIAIRLARLLGAAESGKISLTIDDAEHDDWIDWRDVLPMTHDALGLPDYLAWSEEMQAKLVQAFFDGYAGNLARQLSAQAE